MTEYRYRREVSGPRRSTPPPQVVRERVVERRGDTRGGPAWGPRYEEVTDSMGIGVSVFLLAVGAILAWGVNIATEGVNLNTIGIILMIVGAIGLLFSLLFWSSYAPFGGRREVVRDREIDRGVV
jgi:hypothetical protein